MFVQTAGISKQRPGFPMKNIRFSEFVPRLYNLCTEHAKMRHGTIMPARAFCSDGSQGYPTILMAKHFGTFPFDYGQIGGVFDFGRSPAFATHGKDLVIVQGTHVGYDAQTEKYGRYPRHRTAITVDDVKYTANCGHVAGVIHPYLKGYQSAAAHTGVRWCSESNKYFVSIRNFFLDPGSKFPVQTKLDTSRMLRRSAADPSIAEVTEFCPVTRIFEASDEFTAHLNSFGDRFKQAPIITVSGGSSRTQQDFHQLSDALTQDWFTFLCQRDAASRYEDAKKVTVSVLY